MAGRGGVAELLRDGYERMPREGVAAIAHLLDPEFEVQTAAELPEAGTYRGVEEFEGLLATLAEPFEDIEFEPGAIVELSQDLVIVPLRIRGRGRLSDAPLDIEVIHMWTMRDGRALRLHVFTHLEDVMAAVMRDAYESYNSGSFETIRALMHPDVVLYEEPEIPDATTRHGRDEVARYFVEGGERWETFELDVDRVVQVAEQVIVVTGVMRGRGSLSGVDVESRFGHVYELENWRARRIIFYFDPEKAIEAAGSTGP